MKRFLILLLVAGVSFAAGRMFDGDPKTAAAGGGQGGGGATCSSVNGDVNADGRVDLSDAVTILGYLFLGSPAELAPLCATQRFPSLPTTGMEKCYNGEGVELNCNRIRPMPLPCLGGQDGFYQAGCPRENRFVDNGDGTVTDNCTGLMWQKDTADTNGIGNTLPWCDAIAYCDNLSFAGHEDWRLPNVRELQSIVDYGRHDPAIDPVFGALPSFYWSSTSFADDPFRAWDIRIDIAFFNNDSKQEPALVRAVRNAP